MLRLKSAIDFERVRRDGRAHAHPLAVLIACANGTEFTRWGFAAGRRVGGAVRRNRAKRLLREAARTQAPNVAGGWDLLCIARQPLGQATAAEARDVLSALLHRANVVPNHV